MRLTDRYLSNNLHRFPEIYEHIQQQREKLKELHEENLKLREYERLYKEARELISEKDSVIAKLKKRIEMLVKCNLE